MLVFIYEQKYDKEYLIEEMTIQEAFEYANKILYIHQYMTKYPDIPFMRLLKSHDPVICYTCNGDMVYEEENRPSPRGSAFIDIYKGIRYIPDADNFFISYKENNSTDINVKIIENTEESIFQNSTIYSDYELKHNIIIGTLRQANCREFFLDLNYLEILYNIFTGHTEPPTECTDENDGVYYGYF